MVFCPFFYMKKIKKCPYCGEYNCKCKGGYLETYEIPQIKPPLDKAEREYNGTNSEETIIEFIESDNNLE